MLSYRQNAALNDNINTAKTTSGNMAAYKMTGNKRNHFEITLKK
jgi:hypothetical protein